MIIGIAGTIGAGKGTAVEYLKSKGFTDYSSSGLLGELVEREGNPRIREFLSRMATKLGQEYAGGVVEKNYQEKYLIDTPKDAIFEAIHRQCEADFIKSIGGFIIGIDADIETRYKRISGRKEGAKDDVSFEQFKEDARVEDEGGADTGRDNNIRAVLRGADVVILNEGTVEELTEKTEAAIADLATR